MDCPAGPAPRVSVPDAGARETALLRQARRPEGADGLRMISMMDAVNENVHRRVARLLSPSTPCSVLEMGFGGMGLRRMLPRWVVDYTGVDWSATAVRQATQCGLAGSYVCAAVQAMPFKEHSFDAVFAINTVYWWPDLQAGLREALRVLRPGGAMIVGAVMPEREGGLPSAPQAAAVRAAGAHHYETGELWEALLTAGFEVENEVEMFADRVEFQDQVHYRDYVLFLAYKPESRATGGQAL